MTIKEALEKANIRIKREVSAALNDDVAKAVKVEEVETIFEEVYGVYKPRQYLRRNVKGGIGDIRNISHTVTHEDNRDSLIVVNETEPNPDGAPDYEDVSVNKHLDMLIEYGHGGDGGFYDFPKRGRAYMKPRPFTKRTIEGLTRNKAHVEALRDGLKKRGIKAE